MPDVSNLALINLGDADIEETVRERLGAALLGVEKLGHDSVRLKGVLAAGLSDPRIRGLLVVGMREASGLVEVTESLMERKLPGFEELFRALTFQDVGSPAMFARASLGYSRGRLMVCVAGGLGDVRRALDKLLLPELGRLLEEV